MSKWPMVPLRELVKLDLDAVEVDIATTYPMVGVLSYGRGLFDKEPVSNGNTSYKKFYRLHSNQIVLSLLFGWEGALALCGPDHENKFVSTQFPTFTCNMEKLDCRYLSWFCRYSFIWNQLASKATGMGDRRKTLRPEMFLSCEIPLPPLSEQQKIVEWIDAVATRVEEANNEFEAATKKLDNLLMSAFLEITDGVCSMPMEEVAPLTRRQVEVKQDGNYPELGIRCFGKGTFHKPILNGLDVGTKKLYSIQPGDLIFSNVFAWEGAIAVVKPEDEGRFGSHRFITCVPKPEVATSTFLNFYFKTPKGHGQIQEASPGGAGRNRTLGLKKLEEINVPVPPFKKQLWFDQLYMKTEEARRLISENQKEWTVLIPSVLNHLFNGDKEAS